MKLQFETTTSFSVPQALYKLINKELAAVCGPDELPEWITLNFRDLGYNAYKGGYHPVEIKLVRAGNKWQLVYMTDFSYQGSIYPELVKEIDVCFVTSHIYSLFTGWVNNKEGAELFNMLVENFISYWEQDAYQLTSSFD